MAQDLLSPIKSFREAMADYFKTGQGYTSHLWYRGVRAQEWEPLLRYGKAKARLWDVGCALARAMEEKGHNSKLLLTFLKRAKNCQSPGGFDSPAGPRLLKEKIEIELDRLEIVESTAAPQQETAHAGEATPSAAPKRKGGRPKGTVTNPNDAKVEKLWSKAYKKDPKLTKKAFFENPPKGVDFFKMGYRTPVQLASAIERARKRVRNN